MARWMWVMAALVACSGDDGEMVEPGTCDGGGPVSLELGEGGRSDFVAWSDGDLLIAEDFGGTFSVYVELFTSGLDTREPVTAVVRMSVDGGPTTDAIGQQQLQCDEEVGNGWTGVFAPLPDELQDAGSVEAAEGAPVVLTATLTDVDGEAATAEISGVLSY